MCFRINVLTPAFLRNREELNLIPLSRGEHFLSDGPTAALGPRGGRFKGRLLKHILISKASIKANVVINGHNFAPFMSVLLEK